MYNKFKLCKFEIHFKYIISVLLFSQNMFRFIICLLEFIKIVFNYVGLFRFFFFLVRTTSSPGRGWVFVNSGVEARGTGDKYHVGLSI